MVKIYKLIDPETFEVKYVGKTIQPLKKRLSGHISKSKNSRTAHVNCWIYSLLLKGKKPKIELIEEVINWKEREQYWISYFPNLCNHSLGGESGTLGYKMTDVHKRKISKSLKGRKRPQYVRDKISQGHKGKKVSQETREKLRIYNTGRKQSIEVRKRKAKSPILQYDLNDKYIKEWYSLGQIQEETGFLKGNLSSCCNGRLKSAYGFKWVFKNEDIVQT